VKRLLAGLLAILTLALACACGGGKSGGTANATPEATATEVGDPAIAALAAHVTASTSEEYAGDCAGLDPAAAANKACSMAKGERNGQRAYLIYKDAAKTPDHWAILAQANGVWQVVATQQLTPANASVPGVPWPLAIGAEVIVVGLAPDPCLNVHEGPQLSAKAVDCINEGAKITLAAGPQVADHIAWWQVQGRTGWVAGDYLRYPDAAQ
jgi:hypothetical protein